MSDLEALVPKPERLMRPEVVADIYGVKPETVVDWARTGKIAATRTPGGQWRIYAYAVEPSQPAMEVSA